MVTFTGVATLEEAKRLVREAEAQVATKEPRYVKFDLPGTIYRIQPDKTAHFVGPKGEWEPLGYAWPRCEGLIEVTAADAERQQEERRPKVAKRIDVRVGMLLKEHSSGEVYRVISVHGGQAHARALVEPTSICGTVNNFDTDHYTVLDSYTVQGAK